MKLVGCRTLVAAGLAACLYAALAATALAGTSLQVPIGPRAIAMGGAFSSISDDAEALYWNPAGLPWIGHQEITGTHANLFGSDIQDNYAAFVLPLTRQDAAAVDWYRSGFNDTELNFGENRIDLSYGRKVLPFLSAGGTVKYLTRNTDLDGVSVRNGKGAGLDFGLIATPLSRLRVGVVAQDAFDTKLSYSQGEGTVVAYPRTVRIGASYSPIRDAIVAADLDDRLHVGAEYSPVQALALRAGVQNDGSGDGLTWSAGTGIRWNIVRFDYAYVDHPTLGGTSHFGLGIAFNFNPSQIRIEKAEAHDIYASLYKRYARDPFGTLRVRNLDDQPLEAQLNVFVPRLMTTPSTQRIVLRPRATQEVSLTAIFSPQVLSQVGDLPVQAQISTTYQSMHLPRTEKASARFVAYGPGAIDWSQGVGQAAAFVTTRDAPVDAIAREATRTVALMESGTFGNRNVDFAAALFDALGTLGIAYVPDPNNPYEKISDTPKAVDTVSYPRETLKRRTGDCDDTSVLMAALLENVGIRTEFVDVPGHLFVLASTGVHQRNRLALGLDESRYVVHDEELWIPIETTAIGKGFAEAWKDGMDLYQSANSRGRVQLVDVTDAQSQYEPAEPPGAPEAPTLDGKAFEARLTRDLTEMNTWRADFMESHYKEARQGLEATPAALNEVAHMYFLSRKLDEARGALEHALAKEPASSAILNNLGNVEAAQGNLAKAADRYGQALAADKSDSGVWLNLGLARYAAGDSVGSDEALAKGIELSGGYEAACAVLGLSLDETSSREGTEKMSAAEARQLLKEALRKVPAGSAKGQTGSTPKTVEPARKWTSRVAASRGADRVELSDLLYWKK
jgi:tetratricopeptide (TPR) repeat protein